MSDEEQKIQNLEELTKDLMDPNRLVGISTGFPHLDYLSGGLKEGSLIILAASSGVGKSILALNVLISLARRNINSVYFDLENGTTQSFERMVRIWESKEKDYLKRDHNFKPVMTAISDIQNHITYFSHENLLVMEELKLYDKNKRQTPALATIYHLIDTLSHVHKVFLIDPLQYLEERVNAQEAFNEQGIIVRELKNLAQKRKICILICHHMRKSLMGTSDWVEGLDDLKEIKYRIPTLDSLRGSGKIGDIATDVWGLVRTYAGPTKEDRGKSMLRILKNRTGELGDIKLFMNEDTLTFTENTPDFLKFRKVEDAFDGKAV